MTRTGDSCLHCFYTSIPFFSKTDVLLKHKEQMFINIEMPFLDKKSGLAAVKLLALKTGCTNTIKVKFIRNTGFLDVTINSSEALIFCKDESIGIVDLRSIGHIRYNRVLYSITYSIIMSLNNCKCYMRSSVSWSIP